MTETPAWIRLVLIALGVVIVGLGLVLGWIAWSWASAGLIRSTRYAAVNSVDDPVRFWLFVCIVALLTAAGIAAGCYLVVDAVRDFRRER